MVVPPTEMIPVLIDTAKTLKGSQRRAFIAKTVQAMGRGGQRWAEAHLGWCRGTIRKAMHELHSGMTCLDAFSARRRQRAEEHLPRRLDDIKDIVDGQSQTDRERSISFGSCSDPCCSRKCLPLKIVPAPRLVVRT